MMKKLISIIIPAYNCERWIGQTIESALAQTWSNKEIIIVDDGSTDKTLSVAQKYTSKILKVVHRENGGVASARNYGLKLAQGDYIQWLDSDDLLDKNKIEQQMSYFERYGDSILASGRFGAFYYRIDKAIFKETYLWCDLIPIDWILTRFLKNNWMTTESWLISRKLCEKAGPWNERLILDEDGEYFCRLVSLSEGIKFVPDAKSYYRVGNFASQCMNRSNKALDSLLLSMALSFQYLRSMEDSVRTRSACLKFIQYRALDYFPNDPDIKEKAAKLAQELGGVLTRLDVGWKLRAAEKVFGFEKALSLNYSVRKIKSSLLKGIDKISYDLQKQNKTVF